MEKPRIQDDLFNHVNKEKLEELVIPDDKPCTGGFQTLADEVEKIMMGEFEEMTNSNSFPDVHLERACKLYAVAKNAQKKEKDGITPALRSLEVLKGLEFDTFSKNFKDLLINGLPLPLKIDVETDMKNTKRHLVYIQGPSVILPDASYYQEGKEQQKQMLIGLWSNIATQILAKTDLSAEDQALYLNDTLAFDDLISKLVKTSEEWAEYIKMYNPRKTSGVSKHLKTIKFKNILKDLFNEVPDTVVVAEPRYVKAFETVFNADTFNLYKHWAYVTGLFNSCLYLSEELRDLGSMFFRTLAGIAAITPIDKFAYDVASNIYSEPVGIYYGDKYFGQEAKKDITDIVYQIIDTYKARILTNDILGEETKQKAISKLSKMGVKMGYPDKSRDIFDKLVFDENDSFFDIVSSLSKIQKVESLKKLNEPTNPNKWAMPGHMVNACYDPFVNDITFPAAILQPPFYSIKQTRSENLGGIGAVIGHEISHAFDSNGAKCDENGINNWWTKDDNRRFKAKVNAMIKQFDKIELPWGIVNGSFIVSENMADNGGMAVTLDIMSKTEGVSYEEYFKNWAKVWCLKAKPEYLQLLLNLDVHGPSILRANIPPRNFEEWYNTFDVKETDGMYIKPSKRIIIW